MTAHGARFLVVGGHAVAFHAKPRFTKDVDVFVESSADNAQRVLDALEEFGFGNVGLVVGDFTQPDRVVQLGYPPSRIDILTSIDGVGFEEAWQGRSLGRYGETPVPFLGKADLIKNKRASGRQQDLLDLEWLLDEP